MAYVRRESTWERVPDAGRDGDGRYRWEWWADGRLWFLQRPVDYLAGHQDVIRAAHSFGRRKGHAVSCATVKGPPDNPDHGGGVLVQFMPGPRVCTGGPQGRALPHRSMCTPCRGLTECRYKS